jgi:hypothetical protein
VRKTIIDLLKITSTKSRQKLDLRMQRFYLLSDTPSISSQKPNPSAPMQPNDHLLERNETRRVGSTNTGSTVLDGVAAYSLVP